MLVLWVISVASNLSKHESMTMSFDDLISLFFFLLIFKLLVRSLVFWQKNVNICSSLKSFYICLTSLVSHSLIPNKCAFKIFAGNDFRTPTITPHTARMFSGAIEVSKSSPY